MRILSAGPLSGTSNTCRLRNEALKKIADEVDEVYTDLNPPSFLFKCAFHLFQKGFPASLPDNCGENRKIIELVSKNSYDIVWIDKGITIALGTLKKVKEIQPTAKIVSYSPDNMALRHNQSQNYLECIPLYDVHFTTKSYVLDDLRKLGAKKVVFTPQSFESSFHYPRTVTDDDVMRLGGDVGFVGTWEKERMESILFLTRNGVSVRVFGDKNWQRCKNDNPHLIIEDHGLYDEDYAKSFKCFKISLCFLRKMNFDLHTTRTMEIPACGGFMLAERTKEQQDLFEEGKEAEYFSSDEELLWKCKYYLSHVDERMRIAKGGRERCLKSGYSNIETLSRLVNIVLSKG